MIECSGKSIFKGIAAGKISVYKRSDINVERYLVADPEEEMERFIDAKEQALAQLDELYNLALDEVGGDNASIFMIHSLIMEDYSFESSIEHFIMDGKYNAEYAVSATGKSFCDMFLGMDDSYMQARSADIDDITERLLNILSGTAVKKIACDESTIIFADDLSPSETVQLARGNVIAFATIHGSSSSHTAILTRTMKLPAIVGADIKISPELDGKTALVDGYSGKIYIEPTEEFIDEMYRKHNEEQRKSGMYIEFKNKESITADGRKINIFANVGNMNEIEEAVSSGAEGIGLFRSEFIYLDKEEFPTEDELFEIYKVAAEKMNGKNVTIRPLDVGADKRMSYYGLPEEKNPALGCRGIRYLLSRPDIFRTQMRAIYRAAEYGNVSVLYPMVSTLVDVGRIKNFNNEIIAELDKENISHGSVKQGILIETPSAVIISDLLAREADFLAIGTNDLAQYTMVMDRENALMNDFFDPLNISLFRMIKMVIDNAHRYKKSVGICGEMGADLSLTPIFLAMGINVLSVTPSEIMPLRKSVCSTDVEKISQEELIRLWA